MYKMFIEKIISVKKFFMVIWGKNDSVVVTSSANIKCIFEGFREHTERLRIKKEKCGRSFQRQKFSIIDNINFARLLSYTNDIF